MLYWIQRNRLKELIFWKVQALFNSKFYCLLHLTLLQVQLQFPIILLWISLYLILDTEDHNLNGGNKFITILNEIPSRQKIWVNKGREKENQSWEKRIRKAVEKRNEWKRKREKVKEGQNYKEIISVKWNIWAVDLQNITLLKTFLIELL